METDFSRCDPYNGHFSWLCKICPEFILPWEERKSKSTLANRLAFDGHIGNAFHQEQRILKELANE